MQNTSTLHFNRLSTLFLLTGLSLLAFISVSKAALPDTQCQFSPHLKCSDAAGSALWEKPALDDVSKLTADAHRLYLNQNNQVISFDLNNGRAIWKAHSGPEALFFFPVLNQQDIYLARSDGKLEKRQASTGALHWSRQTGSGWVYPPVIIEGQLVTGGQDRTIWVLDSETGEIATSMTLSQELVMPLANSHALVYASTFDSTISAYQIKTQQGKQPQTVWRSLMDSPVFDIQVSQDALIASDMGGTISSLDPLTGQLKWQQAVHQNAVYWNIQHQQTLYSLSESGLLSAIDLDSGKLLSRRQFTGKFDRPPIVRGESLVLFDTHGDPQQVSLKILNTGHATNLLTFNQTRIQ